MPGAHMAALAGSSLAPRPLGARARQKLSASHRHPRLEATATRQESASTCWRSPSPRGWGFSQALHSPRNQTRHELMATWHQSSPSTWDHRPAGCRCMWGMSPRQRLRGLIPAGGESGRTGWALQASADAGPSGSWWGGGPEPGMGGTAELPLFPLPLVLFPGSILPLQVFELRYRIMMHTLLQTDMRFGVVFSGTGRGGASAVGCVGRIVKHERLNDDRFFLVCKGEERFRVMDVVRTRPYLVGRVSWLEDRPFVGTSLAERGPQGEGLSGLSELDALANEVATIMSNVIRLTKKLKGSTQGPQIGRGGPMADNESAPLDARGSSLPTPFSFWVASTFEGAPLEQQALLELVDTQERLQREKVALGNTLNYLTAASALKDAFPSSDSSSSP